MALLGVKKKFTPEANSDYTNTVYEDGTYYLKDEYGTTIPETDFYEALQTFGQGFNYDTRKAIATDPVRRLLESYGIDKPTITRYSNGIPYQVYDLSNTPADLKNKLSEIGFNKPGLLEEELTQYLDADAGTYQQALKNIQFGDFTPSQSYGHSLDSFTNRQLYENIKQGIKDQGGERFKLPIEQLSPLVDEAFQYDPYTDYRTEYDPVNPNSITAPLYDKIPLLQQGKSSYDAKRKAGFNQRLGIGAGLFLGGVGALGGFDGLFNSLGAGAGGTSLDPLLAESLLSDGLLSASELSSILGPEQASLLGGSLGGGDVGLFDGFSPSDLEFFDNFQFPTESGGFNPADYGLPSDFNFADYIEYPNLAGQEAGPVNALGGSSNALQDVLNFSLETGNFSPLLEKVKDVYGTTSNAYKTVQQVLGAAGSGGGLLGGNLSGLLSTALGLGGTYLNQSAAEKAAQTQANATVEAAKIAADAAKFRPVGVTTRFGKSQFGFDDKGNLSTAGYELSPDIRAQQDALLQNSGGLLQQYLGAQDATRGIGDAGQRAINLGQGYLGTSPEEQAGRYYAEQQALVAPTRERQFADLLTSLQNQGRGGLAVGGTSTLAAANPQLEAYFNALQQQDLQLAANATRGGQDYATFGAGLTGTGADLLNAQYRTQAAAFQPYSTSLGGATYLEGLGQNALDQGARLGSTATAANARSGELLASGLTQAANLRAPTDAISGFGGLLTGAGSQLQNYQQQQDQQALNRAFFDALAVKGY